MKLAPLLRGGETIELKSDLGGGKTTFVRGLVRGLGSNDHVASPTFMISKEYGSPKYRIVHFDFYRLDSAADVAEALREAALDDQTICVVEWGAIVERVLPEDRIEIVLEKLPNDEDERKIRITTSYSSIIDGLGK